MKIEPENFTLLENLIKKAKKILIIVGKTQQVDSFAAALFLKEIFNNLGKDSQIFTQSEVPKPLAHFSEKINNKIEQKKLTISFNWYKNKIEKVSYSLEGEIFNFIITPKNKKIQANDLKISYQGDEPDLIIPLGVRSLSEIDELEQEFFSDKVVINIDKDRKNQLYGRLNFVNEEADSICATVINLIQKLPFSVPSEASEVAFLGLREATENFSKVGDPATFEAAAFCTKIKKGEMLEQPTRKQIEDHLTKTQVPKEWLLPKIFRSKENS